MMSRIFGADSNLSTYEFALVALTVAGVTPLCLIREYGHLAAISALSVVAIGGVVLMVVVHGPAVGAAQGGYDAASTYDTASTYDAACAIPTQPPVPCIVPTHLATLCIVCTHWADHVHGLTHTLMHTYTHTLIHKTQVMLASH